MKKKLLATCLFFASNLGNSCFSQQLNSSTLQEVHPVCATQAPGEDWENWFQTKINEFKNSQLTKSNQASSLLYIPVVVHVIYKNGEASGSGSNLKAAQVQAQIDALNDAMAGNAPGNSSLPAVFANVDAGETNIRFCLASKDKNGNTLSEAGIDRINWGNKGWSDPSTLGNNTTSYFDNTIKPNSIWDPTKYFNIWVADFLDANGAGLIGYATFPAGSGLSGMSGLGTGSSSTDGVVMASRCFGCKAKFSNGYYSQNAYAYGITTVHEVGHWLGLRHISGDGQCGNDYCSDTPPQKGGNNGCSNGLNWGCPGYPFQANQCSGNSNGEMFQNFMDYSDDQCRSLYTANQKTRMQTALNNGTYRTPLLNSTVCNTIDLDKIEQNTSILVYPNPTQHEITIQFDHALPNNNIHLKLTDMLGRTVKNEQVNVQGTLLHFTLNDLPVGMYYLNINDGFKNIKNLVVVKQ